MDEMKELHQQMLVDQSNFFQERLQETKGEFQDMITKQNEHFLRSLKAQEKSLSVIHYRQILSF